MSSFLRVCTFSESRYMFFIRNWFIRNSYSDGQNFKKLWYYVCLRSTKKLFKVKSMDIVANRSFNLNS